MSKIETAASTTQGLSPEHIQLAEAAAATAYAGEPTETLSPRMFLPLAILNAMPSSLDSRQRIAFRERAYRHFDALSLENADPTDGPSL